MNERSSQNKKKCTPMVGCTNTLFRKVRAHVSWKYVMLGTYFFFCLFFSAVKWVYFYTSCRIASRCRFFFRTDSDWCWGLPRSTDWRSLPLLPDPTIPVVRARFQIYELQALDRDEADLELHLRRDWMKDDLRSVPRGHWPIDPPCSSGGGGDGDEVSEIIWRFFAEVCESCHWNLETFQKIASFFFRGDQLLGVT